MRHCKAVGRQARIKFNLNPKSRKGKEIMFVNKDLALLQVQHVQFCCSHLGWHTMTSTWRSESVNEIDFSVFFNTEEEKKEQEKLLRGLMRDGDSIEVKYHTDTSMRGGWIDYTVEFSE